MKLKNQGDSDQLIQSESQELDVKRIVSIIWNSWKFIAKVTCSLTILMILVSLFLPEYFKSTAVILPETEKSKLAGFGGLSDLASLAGMNVGGEGSLAKLYQS